MAEQESAELWSSWFLDAIRTIRGTNQRPTVDKLCRMIRKNHNYHHDEICEHLEVAVKRGDVRKIFYQGTPSYRDSATLTLRPITVHKTTNLYSIFGRAVRELCELEGSAIEDIERYVRQRCAVEEITVGALSAALKLAGGRHRRILLRNARYHWQFPLLEEMNDEIFDETDEMIDDMTKDGKAPGLPANEVS